MSLCVICVLTGRGNGNAKGGKPRFNRSQPKHHKPEWKEQEQWKESNPGVKGWGKGGQKGKK